MTAPRKPVPDDAGNRLVTRRSVVALAFSAFSAPILAGMSPRGATAASSNGAAQVAPGVFVHTGEHAHAYTAANLGDISNNGFIVGREAVAVIDTGGTAAYGRRLRDAIRAVTDRPVRYVVNTHMHPDHVLGNAAFRADAPRFAGHHKLAAALSARAERYLSFNREQTGPEGFAGTEIVLPDLAVETTLELDLGDRIIRLEAHRTAHTDNDLTVRDMATDTVFMGDLIFSGHVPTLDGSIRGWIALLDAMKGRPAARIVPGHGPASMAWPDAAVPLERYLGAIATDVRKAIKAGRTLSETLATAASGERDQWELFDGFHARNVSAAFAELEWE